MDYYKSRETLHGEVERRRRLRRTMLVTGISLFILIVVIASVHFWYQSQEDVVMEPKTEGRSVSAVTHAERGTPNLFQRLAVSLSGRTPQVYSVLVEKNGGDVILKPDEPFEVTYRDEFVVKQIVTDAFFTSGISARIEGDGTPISGRMIVKGVDLVNRLMKAQSEGGKHPQGPDYRLIIRYDEKTIAVYPFRVVISGQDWLRAAQADPSGSSEQIVSLKRALASNPQDVEVRRLLAAAYVKKGQTEQAIGEYQLILRSRPDDMRSLVALASLLMEAKRYGEALPLYQKIISRDSRDSAAYANAGLAASRLERWKEAAAYYKESLRIKPDNAAVVLRLAEAQRRAGNSGQAAAHYEAYLKKHPNDLDTLAALGDIYMKQKRYGEAVEIFKKAVSVKGGDPVLHYNLAWALSSAKQNEEAITEYGKVLKLAPADRDARIDLAQLYVQEKHYDKATEQFQKVLKDARGLSREKMAIVHAGLGYAYGELKDYSKSTLHYEKAVALGLKDPTVLKNLKAVRAKSGDKSLDVEHTENVSVKDKRVQKLVRSAEDYIRQKKYDKALVVYRKITQLSTGRAEGYVGMGRAYGLQGNVEKEIDNYRIALTVGGDKDDRVYLLLGEAYERRGRYALALEAYKAAYEKNADSPAAGKIPALKIKMIQQKYDRNAAKN